MDILFNDEKLQQVCNHLRLAQRRFGLPRAKRLLSRLSELRAAETLEDFGKLKRWHPHELEVPLLGKLAVDVDERFRIIFEPVHEPIPRKPDGGLDWSKVMVIRVLAVRDYHG